MEVVVRELKKQLSL